MAKAKWSARDVSDARRIALAVGEPREDRILGAYSLGFHAGLGQHTHTKERLVRRVQYLMPLVTEVVHEVHPGWVMGMVPGRPYEYRLWQADDARAVVTEIPRLKAAKTKVRRARYALPHGHPLARFIIRNLDRIEGELDEAISDVAMLRETEEPTPQASEAAS